MLLRLFWEIITVPEWADECVMGVEAVDDVRMMIAGVVDGKEGAVDEL